jgi:hypothetical protein
MNLQRGFLARFLFGAFAALLAGCVAVAAERTVPPRLASAPGDALSESDRQAVVSWALARPEVRTAISRHRTRVLRVGSDLPKGEGASSRRATVLLRDYDSGLAHEVTIDLAAGRVQVRALAGIVPPNPDEIAEGIEIVRRDAALAAFNGNPALTLMGGFFNRSPWPDDPCSREICLEFQFMRPGYEKGPTRGVIVNLTRRIVCHHDFRAPTAAGESPPRMTERIFR